MSNEEYYHIYNIRICKLQSKFTSPKTRLIQSKIHFYQFVFRLYTHLFSRTSDDIFMTAIGMQTLSLHINGSIAKTHSKTVDCSTVNSI